MTVWLPSAIWAAIQFWQFIASLYVSISSGVFPPFSMACSLNPVARSFRNSVSASMM